MTSRKQAINKLKNAIAIKEEKIVTIITESEDFGYSEHLETTSLLSDIQKIKELIKLMKR